MIAFVPMHKYYFLLVPSSSSSSQRSHADLFGIIFSSSSFAVHCGVAKVATSKFLSLSSRIAAALFKRHYYYNGLRRISTVPGEGSGSDGVSGEAPPQTTETLSEANEQGSSSASALDSSKNRRVFIGNLAYRTTVDALQEHLSSVGNISTCQILTNNLGRSVGGAIVEFDSEEAAKKAIETLNDTELDGRRIIIREDREDFSLHDPRRKMKQGDPKQLQNKRIVVWNLPSHVRWQELKDLFKESGNILWTEVKNVRTKDGGETVMGTVLFESEEDARRAVERMRGRNFLVKI